MFDESVHIFPACDTMDHMTPFRNRLAHYTHMASSLLINGEACPTAYITKSGSIRLIKLIKLFGYSSSNSFITAWYAPRRCLRSSDTRVLTQQDLLLVFFLYFITVAKMVLEAAMMIVRFCFLDIICFVFASVSMLRPP